MNNNEIIVPELNNDMINSMIYEIRGVKVMLDFNLAEIYGYTTSRFNEQVKRNKDKFENDFMFQLTKTEWDDFLLSHFATAKNISKNRFLPYAFTEQGIYMLMTVLKGELATKQSKMLIRLFKQMKDYLVESNNLLSSDELLKLTSKVYSNEKNIEMLKNDNITIKKKLEIVMDNFIDPNKYKHFLILDGCRIEADLAYQEIYKNALKSIYIIDDYIDIKTLQLLKICNIKIDVIIFTDNKAKNSLNKAFINDFIKDTNINILFKKNNNRFHDRYIIIDYKTDKEKIYHCGASSKDSGNKITTIQVIDDIFIYNHLIDELLNNDNYIF